jgi:hypothetical protein
MTPHLPIGEVMIAMFGSFLLFGWPMVWIVAHYWHQDRKQQREMELKQEMVVRGYTAQEILAVVGSKKRSADKASLDAPPEKKLLTTPADWPDAAEPKPVI